MQGYYEIPTEDTSAMDFQYWMDYVADMKRYPVAPMTLKGCGNPLCSHQSYAVYCSPYCLEAVEGTEEPSEADDYFHSDDITLGHKATAETQHRADLAAGGFAAMVCGVQPQAAPVAVQAPVVPTFPEAPISLTLKGLCGGVDTMLTIRGGDLASVQAQLAQAAAWFDAPAAAQSPPVETGEGFCDRHSTPMRWNPGKGGESGWWSHKGPDGWCKGGSKGKVAQHG